MKALIVKKGYEKSFEKAMISGNRKRIQGFFNRGTVIACDVENGVIRPITYTSGTVRVIFNNTSTEYKS